MSVPSENRKAAWSTCSSGIYFRVKKPRRREPRVGQSAGAEVRNSRATGGWSGRWFPIFVSVLDKLCACSLFLHALVRMSSRACLLQQFHKLAVCYLLRGLLLLPRKKLQTKLFQILGLLP